MLPRTLKENLVLFLYWEAITLVPFFQNRNNEFYLNFLEKLIPFKFPAGETILRKGSKPEEIFFILKGKILNVDSQRVLSGGSMLGETDIFYHKRERVEEYVTLTRVFALKL